MDSAEQPKPQVHDGGVQKDDNHLIIHVHLVGRDAPYIVAKNEFTIGSDPSADISILNHEISEKHVSIRMSFSQFFIRDLGSNTGTFIGPRKVKPFEEVELLNISESFSLGKTLQFSIELIKIKDETASHKPTDHTPLDKIQTARKTAVRVEIESHKKKALQAIDAVQLNAVNIAEKIKGEASIEAKAVLETAKQNAETIKEAAQLRSESLIGSARREAESLLKEGKRKLEETKAEAELIKSQAHREAEILQFESTRRIKILKGEATRESQQLLKDAETIKNKAEIELAEAERSAFNVKEKSDREIKELKSKIEFESQLLKDQAYHESKEIKKLALLESTSLKEAAEREADAIRKEMKAIVEAGREQKEILDRDIQSLSTAKNTLQMDCQSQLQELNTIRQKTETYIQQNEQEKIQSELLIREGMEHLGALNQNQSELEQKIFSLERSLSVLERNSSDLESKKTETESIVNSLELRETDLKREVSLALDRLSSLKLEIKGNEEALIETKERLLIGKDQLETDERNRKKINDAFASESQSRKLSLETSMGHLEVKKIELERELQLIKTEKQTIDLQLSESKDKFRELETQFVATKKDIESGQLKLEDIEKSYRQKEMEISTFQQMTDQVQSETNAIEQKLIKTKSLYEEMKSKAELELATLRKEINHEIDKNRKKLENDSQLAKSQLDKDLADTRQNALSSLESDLNKKKKNYEIQLNLFRETESEKIKKISISEFNSSEERMNSTLNSLIEVTSKIENHSRTQENREELRGILKLILEGKPVPTFNFNETHEIQKPWLKIGLGATTSLLGIALIFKAISGNLEDKTSRMLASDPQNQPVKVQLSKDQTFRDTYSENILHLTRYKEIKTDPILVQNWRQTLTKFFLNQDENSHLPIQDLVDIESALIADLLKITLDGATLPLEKSLHAMLEREKQSVEKMKQTLQTPGNYQNFRTLEKSYFLENIEHPVRAIRD